MVGLISEEKGSLLEKGCVFERGGGLICEGVEA